MDDKDRIIAELRQENAMLREEIQSLKEDIARLKKNSGNSSKPPSSDIVKPKKVTRKFVNKRKRGAQHGHRKFTRQPFNPEEVDETIEYEFYAKDAKGLEPLDEWLVIQQIVLPKKMYKVIEHKARKYLDPATGKIYIAPIPDEIRKGGLLGADAAAMTAFMKGGCHMSFSTIKKFFREIMKLDISQGMFCKATQKVSGSLEVVYNKLAARLPDEPYIGVDETGHKDEGKKHWTWCFQTPEYTLFHINQSRGSEVLFNLLGKEFRGIIGCDFYSSYRKFYRLSDALVQYCMAHLIREILFLCEHPVKLLACWAKKLLKWLKKIFDTLHHSDSFTDECFARRMRQIKNGFLRQMRQPPDHKLAKKLARRFKGENAENYFRFLTDPGIEPTNNGTEREIRHTVIDRRITQGTRGQAGMRWCERIWTTIATCKKQKRNVFEFIHQSLLAHWTKSLYPELL
ncbi:MAG: IS66 family transposase [Candidatus Aenigmatarchaeota archaeon]